MKLISSAKNFLVFYIAFLIGIALLMLMRSAGLPIFSGSSDDKSAFSMLLELGMFAFLIWGPFRLLEMVRTWIRNKITKDDNTG